MRPDRPPRADFRPYNDPCYEPLWTLTEELGLVLHTHSGAGPTDIGLGPGMIAIYASEAGWWAARPLAVLIWGGIFERHRDTVRAEREALRAGRRAQFEAVHGASFDEERIRAAVATTARAQADLVVTRARIAGDVRAMLTPEQRTELDEMIAEARGRAQERRKIRAEQRRPR